MIVLVVLFTWAVVVAAQVVLAGFDAPESFTCHRGGRHFEDRPGKCSLGGYHP